MATFSYFLALLGNDKTTYAVDKFTGVLFGAVWVLARLPEGISGEVQLGGYRGGGVKFSFLKICNIFAISYWYGMKTSFSRTY